MVAWEELLTDIVDMFFLLAVRMNVLLVLQGTINLYRPGMIFSIDSIALPDSILN